jgi:HPt (histidine-containing phosphotransfer) domain-containing protein
MTNPPEARQIALPEVTWSLPDDLRELGQYAGAETIADLLCAFREDTESRLAKIRAALGAADLTEARGEAHAIKGGATQMGAPGLGELCERLETLAGPEALTQGLSLLDELDRHFGAISARMSMLNLEALFGSNSDEPNA